MNNLSKFFVLVLIAVIVLCGVFALGRNSSPVVGAVSGSEHYNAETFYAPVTFGGTIFATTSQGTGTYTYANLKNAQTITHTATAALTVTLPASTTLNAFIPKAGDTRTIFVNAVTTKITFAGGTGTTLLSASSTKDVIAGGTGRFDFVRKANSDIQVLFTTGI